MICLITQLKHSFDLRWGSSVPPSSRTIPALYESQRSAAACGSTASLPVADDLHAKTMSGTSAPRVEKARRKRERSERASGSEAS